MSCVRGKPWSLTEKQRLQQLAHADRATLLSAFPDRQPAAVLCAVKRCASKPRPDQPPAPIDGARARARLRALPLEVMLDALPALMARISTYRPPATSARPPLTTERGSAA